MGAPANQEGERETTILEPPSLIGEQQVKWTPPTRWAELASSICKGVTQAGQATAAARGPSHVIVACTICSAFNILSSPISGCTNQHIPVSCVGGPQQKPLMANEKLSILYYFCLLIWETGIEQAATQPPPLPVFLSGFNPLQSWINFKTSPHTCSSTCVSSCLLSHQGSPDTIKILSDISNKVILDLVGDQLCWCWALLYVQNAW